MRRTMFAVSLTAATAFAVVFGNMSASAQVNEDFEQYRTSMADFAPVLGDWIVELNDEAERVAAKPELACGQDLALIATRGTGMYRDLNGTGRLAPAAIADAHASLTDAIQSLSETAANGCALGEDLVQALADDTATARRALLKIARYANAPGQAPIELPVPPVTVN